MTNLSWSRRRAFSMLMSSAPFVFATAAILAACSGTSASITIPPPDGLDGGSSDPSRTGRDSGANSDGANPLPPTSTDSGGADGNGGAGNGGDAGNDANTPPADGSCGDTQSDPNNCGSCGNGCATGYVCKQGQCTCETSRRLTFDKNVAPILEDSCATGFCHQNANNLDLRSNRAFESLDGKNSEACSPTVKLVVKGDPEASYLYRKVVGTNLCAGSRMPLVRGPLSSEDIATIRDWICGGAVEK